MKVEWFENGKWEERYFESMDDAFSCFERICKSMVTDLITIYMYDEDSAGWFIYERCIKD